MKLKKVREKYEKLKKKYPALPSWKKLLMLGFFEEEDFESVIDLAKAVRRSLLELQSMFQSLVVPHDFISMHDQKFLRDMRDEILRALAKSAYITRTFSARTVEALKSEDVEGKMAEVISFAVEEGSGLMEVYYRAVRVLEEKWKEADIEEEEPNYRW